MVDGYYYIFFVDFFGWLKTIVHTISKKFVAINKK
jgi:hypothetical protein